MGAYDLPASLRVVRQTTGASSVGVVCHSQVCAAGHSPPGCRYRFPSPTPYSSFVPVHHRQGCSLTIGGLSASTNSSFRDSVNVVAALAPVTCVGADVGGVRSEEAKGLGQGWGLGLTSSMELMPCPVLR